MGLSGNDTLRLAIVGATGVVGGQLLELIDGRSFPCSELKLFSSEEHGGESLESGGETRRVAALSDPSELADSDVAFLALPRSGAEEIVRAAPGPILVDLSAAMLPPDNTAGFAAPGFTTRDQVRELSRAGLFQTPHPAALALATIINALGAMPFCAATLMAGASSMGHKAIGHLVEQSADLLNGKLDVKEDESQTAFNSALFPCAAELESALIAQIARLTGAVPQLVLQTVLVPVLHGTAIVLSLPSALGSDTWAAALRAAPGVLLVDNDEPLTVVDAIGQEALLLSLAVGASGSSLWCVFDNARRAALAALWIAECLVTDAAGKLN
jgi:aspartate-semialdehyde dehydrogenase